MKFTRHKMFTVDNLAMFPYFLFLTVKSRSAKTKNKNDLEAYVQ